MFLRALLFLTVALPALALSVGRADGRVVFVLYREPKLVVALCGSWLLLAVLAWTRPEAFRVGELLATVQRPPVALGLLLGGWLMLTRLWVRVPENWLYEATQYATFGALLLVLATWARSEKSVLFLVRAALVASLAVVAMIGVLQWFGASLPVELPPIRPELGARHPSVMGYKNPAALAVVGQLFLLLGWAVRAANGRLRIAWLALAGIELAYVVSLGSRTAILALGVGFAFLLAAMVVTTRGRVPRVRTLRVVVAGATLFILALGFAAANPGLRQRLGSMVDLTLSPSAFLDTDRGIYLRNTLNMARHEPLGVGLGDWQTAYPVYRKYGRDVSFDGSFEVRRAHSDHVQMLGEAGWPGLALWLGWLALLMAAPLRDFSADCDPQRLFVAAQVAALAAAMAVDYVVELPYGKFQLFLVAALALGGSTEKTRAANRSTADLLSRPGRMIFAGVVTGLALVVCHLQIGHLEKTQTAGEIARRYEAALSEVRTAGRVKRKHLEGTLDLGDRFERPSAGDKTTYRAHLMLSHSALLLRRHGRAQSAARRALELHPYSVDALAMMARVVPEPCAESWRQAERRIVEEATDGYVWVYPTCGSASSR